MKNLNKRISAFLSKRAHGKVLNHSKYSKFMALGLVFLATSCGQGVNWREINVGDLGVSIWLPCKPNTTMRQIPLSEDSRVGEISINLIECEKDGLQYAVSYMDMESASKIEVNKDKKGKIDLDKWMSLWEKASLRAVGIKQDKELAPWNLSHTPLYPAGKTVRAKSETGLEVLFIWFGYQGALYQVAVYSTTSLEKNKGLVETLTTSVQIK